MSTPPRSLVTALVDDAAMFPPGNASAEAALAEHLRVRSTWFADLVGPLLVPARAWGAFVAAHRASDRPEVTVVLVGTSERPDDVPDDVTVSGYELAVEDAPLPAWPSTASLAAEIVPGAAGSRVLDAVSAARRAGRPVVAKYRTGGTTAEAFPSEDALADVICSAVAAHAPLKLTAGLHHAVRHRDPGTGFEHHGFVNVLVAVREALDGGSRRRVAEPLALRSGRSLVDEIARWSPDEVAAVRAAFVSFGCCGVSDPVDDLLSLGLVPREEIA